METLILSTLSSIAADGFAPEAIEASLNTIEFSLREFNTGSYPKVRGARRPHTNAPRPCAPDPASRGR